VEKEYADYVKDLRLTDPDLANRVAGRHGLESVLNWTKGIDLPPGSVDLIGQDEFAYDFLVELEPGGPWLAFGLT
jgi:hypothetical protein